MNADVVVGAECGVWKVLFLREHKMNLGDRKNFPRMSDNQINAEDSPNVAVLSLNASVG